MDRSPEGQSESSTLPSLLYNCTFPQDFKDGFSDHFHKLHLMKQRIYVSFRRVEIHTNPREEEKQLYIYMYVYICIQRKYIKTEFEIF